MPTDHAVEPEPEAGDARRQRRSRILIALVVLLTLTYWIWVFLGDPPDNPDHISDRSWTRRSERICASTVADLDELPDAEETPEAADRAEAIDEANGLLRAMIAELGGEAPAGGVRDGDSDAEVVEQWLADWRTYLDDRQVYVDDLRADGEALLLLSSKDGRGMDAVISDFAEMNEMPSCAAPGDVG